MPQLTEYNYVFAIGTLFALLDAYNNGASESIPSSKLKQSPPSSYSCLPIHEDGY